MSEKYYFIFQNDRNVWSTASFNRVAKHETWRVTNVTRKIQKTVRVQSYSVAIYIYVYEFFNCVYSYFCATSWIFEFEMWKVSLYHFALCTVPFCRVHGAKWYSWPHILNGWFQALLPLYACISFSLVVLSCQPRVTVTSCFIYKVIRT